MEPKAYLPLHLLCNEIMDEVDSWLFISAIKLLIFHLFNDVRKQHTINPKELISGKLSNCVASTGQRNDKIM